MCKAFPPDIICSTLLLISCCDIGACRLFVLLDGGFLPESNFTILSPAFLFALAGVGLGGVAKLTFLFGFFTKKRFYCIHYPTSGAR